MPTAPLRPVLALSCLALLAACGSAADPGTAASPSPGATVVDGEKVYSDLSRDHVEGIVDYPQSPPVGGEHSPVWAACDGRVYDEPLADENAVHSLEHGAVWVTWLPSLPAADVETLHALVEGVDYRLGSPYPGQAAPVVVTAWGHQMTADSVTDPRIETFVTAYTNGPQTPEPGATCQDPSGQPPDTHSD